MTSLSPPVVRASLTLAASLALATASPAQDCDGTSVGMVPLPDLGSGHYQGVPGGLFPGGDNHEPPAHDADGLAAAATIVPRAPNGAPHPDGVIVLLSIGLSNTTQEWSVYMAQTEGDPDRNPQVVVVDGAQGGVPAEEAANPDAPYWNVVLQRLTQAGVTPQQVQAVWMKTAEAGPTDPFPLHAQNLQADMADMVRNVKALCPNTAVLYHSSRIYAGYATTTLNPEPWAYESGFAVKWLIEDQIGGDPALNHDPAAGPVLAPWMTWGPYLWADGLDARSDLLEWACGDYQADGTHPGTPARVKVADLLEVFFETHASSRPWYLASPGVVCGPQARAESYGQALPGGGGPPRLVADRNPTVPTLEPLRLHAWNVAPGAFAGFVVGFTAFAPGQLPFKGGSLLVDPALILTGVAGPLGKQWQELGVVPPDGALCGLDVYAQYASVDAGAIHGVALSRGLRLALGH